MIRVFANSWMMAALAFSAMVFTQEARAAVCCGGHAAIPTLITGFEKGRFNTAASYSSVIGDAPAEGTPVFRRPEDRAVRNVVRISGSHKIGDRWQAGLGLPSTLGGGIGDADAVVAFKAVPRPSLMSWHPEGYLFSQAIFPTGRSIHEAPTADESKIAGGGVYRLALGMAWLTTWRKWDVFVLSKSSYGFPRRFMQGQALTKLHPGLTADGLLGGGYALSSRWRLGGAVTAAVQEAYRQETALGTRTSSSRLVWPVSAQVSHFYDMNNTLTASYEDETLLGPVRNTTLSRTVSLHYSYRWSGGN